MHTQVSQDLFRLPEYALSGPYTRVYLRVVLTYRIQFGINMIKKKKQVN